MDIESSLREAGLRVTKQRVAVLKLLIDKGSPLSHNEISQLLDEPLDKVTLYRVLETLLEAELVHHVQGLDGVWRFCAHEYVKAGSAEERQHYKRVDCGRIFCLTDHPHFQCVECGKMFCLTDQRMPRVDVPDGVTVEGKQFVVYGRCGECNSKK